jgi:hypothetical protein
LQQTPPPKQARRSILARMAGSKSTKIAAMHAKPSVHRAAAAVTGDRLIATKTSTGKTAPYDYSKASNLCEKTCA